MRIRRLRLAGFKSFVDPADMVIAPGLTGIVGPNGCGKSNLLEALRWTMGETSAKSLRGAGMDDVIFAGTATRPPRDFAEVSILADGADGGDIEVVRRIERGAGSAYRLNGRDVRAKDVALLFADAATGAHSPALVSQGRIGAVIAAKPADRRQMLEEAAGIAGLHVRRKDAEARLRATEANLARIDELVGDMAQREAALRRQARQAERYRRLSDAARTAEARLIFARWREADQAATAASAEAEACEGAVAGAQADQAAAAAASARAMATLAAARAQAQVARDTARDAAHRLDTLTTERRTVDDRLAALAQQVAALRDDRAREGLLAEDAAEAIARLTQGGRVLSADIARGMAAAPQLSQAVQAAEAAVRDAEVALARALATQAAEQAERRVLGAADAAGRARRDRAAADAARVAAERTALGDSAPLAIERDRQVQAAGQARGKIAQAEADEAAATRAREAALATRECAQTRLATARADRAALAAEGAALRRGLSRAAGDRAIDAMRAAPGYERALAAALGDDIEGGLAGGARRWTGAAVAPDDPPLPPGCVRLADHVAAPASLARRLAQVAVVGKDAGQPLAVGQRLVTLDGRMRRWDGFVAGDDGAMAAERLVRANRLAEIDGALHSAAAEEVVAAEAVAQAADGLKAAEAAVEAAWRSRQASEAAERTALAAAAQAASSLERLAGRRADLDARAERAASEAAAADDEVAKAADALSALPDPAQAAGTVARLTHDAEQARGAAATARAAAAGHERALATQRERQAAGEAEARGWRARAGEAARRIADMAKRDAALSAEAQALMDRPEALDRRIADIAAAADAAQQAVARLEAQAAQAEDASVADAATAAAAGEALTAAREARAGAVARAEGHMLRRVEMGRVSGERFQCPAPLLPERVGFAGGSVGPIGVESAAHDRLLAERERIGPVNLVAESELAALEGERSALAAEREELGQAVNRLRGSIGSLNREGRERLLAAFHAVDGHFRRLFATLFGGGEAHLALVDADDPLEAGLEIMAQPPGKRLQSLTLLSGGEQALTAVALIFGLFLTNPAPICVLDEVDAPLDDANIERFCDLLDAMTRETDTRYLIVTHNAVTMSRMHRLYGVTMIERGVSRLVSVDLSAAETLLAAE